MSTTTAAATTAPSGAPIRVRRLRRAALACSAASRALRWARASSRRCFLVSCSSSCQLTVRPSHAGRRRRPPRRSRPRSRAFSLRSQPEHRGDRHLVSSILSQGYTTTLILGTIVYGHARRRAADAGASELALATPGALPAAVRDRHEVHP